MSEQPNNSKELEKAKEPEEIEKTESSSQQKRLGARKIGIIAGCWTQ